MIVRLITKILVTLAGYKYGEPVPTFRPKADSRKNG